MDVASGTGPLGFDHESMQRASLDAELERVKHTDGVGSTPAFKLYGY